MLFIVLSIAVFAQRPIGPSVAQPATPARVLPGGPIPPAIPACLNPIGLHITQPGMYTLCPGVYHNPGGIMIESSDVTLDCNGATLWGEDSIIAFFNQSRNWSSLRGFSGIVIYGGFSRVTVRNCNVERYYTALMAREGKRNLHIYDNVFSDSAHGIITAPMYDSIVNDNEFYDIVRTGIALSGFPPTYPPPSNNLIINNYLHDFTRTYMVTPLEGPPYWVCPGTGIQLNRDPSSNTIRNNHLERICVYGIWLLGDVWNPPYSSPRNNLVEDNFLKDVYYRAIKLFFAKQNSILHNVVKLWTGSTVYLENSTGNKMYQNSLEINQGPGDDPYDADGSNLWDDGSEGNYYIDPLHPCTDLNRDHICDQPYNIPGSSNSVDHNRLARWS